MTKDKITVAEPLKVNSFIEENATLWANALHYLSKAPVELCIEIAEYRYLSRESKLANLHERLRNIRVKKGKRYEYIRNTIRKMIAKIENEDVFPRFIDEEHAKRVVISGIKHIKTNYDEVIKDLGYSLRNGMRPKKNIRDMAFEEIKPQLTNEVKKNLFKGSESNGLEYSNIK